MDKFLAINKEYFNLTGKYKLNNKNVKIEILHLAIIAHIEEFERNKASCYLTNEQMANIFVVKNNPRAHKVIRLIDFKIYDYVNCAATDNNLSRVTITSRCKAHKDFMYYDEWLAEQKNLKGEN